jgi:hypothetical protein
LLLIGVVPRKIPVDLCVRTPVQKHQLLEEGPQQRYETPGKLNASDMR